MDPASSDNCMKPKIALLHSETRSYRVPLFDLLSKNYDITFYFMYGAGWSKQYPESKHWKYKDMKRISMIGYGSDFSSGIIFELFKKYDIIITSGLASFATHASFLIAKITGKKLILWDETWDWPHTFWAKFAKPYAKCIVRHADACIAAGTRARDLYIQFGANPKKVFIAPNVALDFSKYPVRQDLLRKMKRDLGIENKKVILYLSRIVQYKGLDYLIKAFQIIEQKDPGAFLLVGGDGAFRGFCEQLAKDLRIKNIRFLGEVPHDKVHYYYHLCDVFVLPSRHLYTQNECSESWGLVLNEVMSIGKPVVSTTAVAGAYDLIKNGKNGYLVREKNSDILAEKILIIFENNQISKVMSQNSKKIIRSFSPNEQYKGFQEAITLVLRS